MARVRQIERGFIEAITVVFVISLLIFLAIRATPAPSPDLLDGLASLGTGLLLAYVIEAAWVTRRMRAAKDYEKRLGVFVGLAASGLIGVVVALLVSAHRVAGHSNFLDDFGLAWVVVSLSILGSLVVIHPLLIHEWQPSDEED